MTTKHLLIKGKVQGVFYRATAKEMADKIGIKGWVKNTKEGDVEITAIGTTEQLTQFIDWCWQGPKAAKVTEVIETEVEPEHFEGFTIRR